MRPASYRFVAVPPGEYVLSFELPGFATVKREGVRLTANFTATINIADGRRVADSRTCSSPAIRRSSTSSPRTSRRPSTRRRWPTCRAPATTGPSSPRRLASNCSASTSAAAAPARRRPTSSTARPIRTGRWSKGINSTEGTGAFGNYVDYGSFEEVSIGSGASSAESPVPGVFVQLISKSGGNQYRGSFYGDYESKDWQSYNIDAAQIATGVTGGGGLDARDTNRLNSYRDLNGDVGGYLKKDKIWFYGSLRALDSSVRYVELSGQAARDASAQPDRQADLPALAEQQAGWLLPAEHQGAEQPPRSPVAARRHRPRST